MFNAYDEIVQLVVSGTVPDTSKAFEDEDGLLYAHGGALDVSKQELGPDEDSRTTDSLQTYNDFRRDMKALNQS